MFGSFEAFIKPLTGGQQASPAAGPPSPQPAMGSASVTPQPTQSVPIPESQPGSMTGQPNPAMGAPQGGSPLASPLGPMRL